MKEVEKTLERIRDMQLEIDEMYELLKTTRERATNISQALSDMPKVKGAATSKTERAALNLLLQVQQTEAKINQFLIVHQLVEDDIAALIKDRRKQTVLKFRYIYNYSWKRIARMMRLSIGQVHKHKQIALGIIEKIFENDTK